MYSHVTTLNIQPLRHMCSLHFLRKRVRGGGTTRRARGWRRGGTWESASMPHRPSTTPKPIFDGTSRGRSQAKLQDGCRLARHWSGCRPRLRWRTSSSFAFAPIFDLRFDGRTHTMHVRAAVQPAVEKEQSRGVSAILGRKRCASSGHREAGRRGFY